MSRPIQVTAWMLGHYQARKDDNKFLSDVPLEDLDRRYVAELERRAYKEAMMIEGTEPVYTELKNAYIEIGEQQEMIIELRKLLKMANERV